MRYVERYFRAAATQGLDQAGVAVAIFIFYALVGAHLNGARVISILDRWQTLITGLFAIWAAFLTVRHMTAIDAKQGRRHQELIRLQLRADSLAIDRAAHPTVERLEEFLSDLSRAQIQLIAMVAVDQAWDFHRVKGFPITADGVGRSLHKLVSAAADIRLLLDADEIKEALPLFGSLMRTARTEALGEIRTVLNGYVSTASAGVAYFNFRGLDSPEGILPAIRNIIQISRDIVEAADDFRSDLDSLDKTYRQD